MCNLPDNADAVPLHRDLRSDKRAYNRHTQQSAKYYGYRGVDPNWIGQLYDPLWRKAIKCLCGPSNPERQNHLSRPDRVKIYTKKDMWQDRDFNIWPLDRRHHVGKKIREKSSWNDQERISGRSTKQKSRMLNSEVEEAWHQNTFAVSDVLGDMRVLYYELEDNCSDYNYYGGSAGSLEEEELDLDSVQTDDEWTFVSAAKFGCSWHPAGELDIISEHVFDVISVPSSDSSWAWD